MSPRSCITTAVLVALLPILLVGGVWLGGHPEDLPAFAQSGLLAGGEARVANEAVERISSDYYRPISKSSLVNASVAGAVASLHDRFSHYLTPQEFRAFDAPPSFTGVGVEVQPDQNGLLIVRVFNSSPAARAGLMPGESIIAVNGRSIAKLSAEVSRALIVGPPGTDVTLSIEARAGAHARTSSHSGGAARGSGGAAARGGGSLQGGGGPARGASGARGRRPIRNLKLTRAVISEPVVASATRTVQGIKLGVVALATFSPGAHGEVREAVEHELHAGVRGLVFDLRDNGGGLVSEAQLIASIFIEHGTIVTTRGRTVPTQTLSAVGDAISPSIPVVVLVDANTASAAEIVTAALQDHNRATVVGTHTFGKGVFQEEMPLPNGGALDVTVGEYFTPNGRNLGGGGIKQGAGVKPEVLVPHGVDSPHGLEVALDVLAAKVK